MQGQRQRNSEMEIKSEVRDTDRRAGSREGAFHPDQEQFRSLVSILKLHSLLYSKNPRIHHISAQDFMTGWSVSDCFPRSPVSSRPG